MDILQIALVLLILLLIVFLSVLGLQVFFILRDLKKAAEKIDRVMGSATHIATDMEKPAKAVAAVSGILENGAKVVAEELIDKNKKSAKRFFRR
jgi:hypothetical protein